MTAATFEMIVSVLPGDIDEQNHVNNTVYLRWIQDVATAHWKSLASAESQAAIGWIVLRHEIDYKMPASLGNEILLRTWVGKASRLKFERFTEIRRKSGRSNAEPSSGEIDPPQDGFAVANNQVLAQARTVWVPIDVRTGKPARVSADVRARFSTS
ncbi:MAG TPA: thioesterase family protein [Chthoniobacterales bacterium]|nr:thioesterase family protein [Chthoniobacterales bacterium]